MRATFSILGAAMLLVFAIDFQSVCHGFVDMQECQITATTTLKPTDKNIGEKAAAGCVGHLVNGEIAKALTSN